MPFRFAADIAISLFSAPAPLAIAISPFSTLFSYAD
jgi:hypothetical protein